MALPDQIRSRRVEKGWTMAELARRTGLSKGYVHDLENGAASRPGADVLYKIAVALDTTPGALMERTMPTDEDAHVDVPESLRAFAQSDDLTDEDIRMLAAIKYKGERPKTTADWAFVWESIKRAVR